MPFRERPLLIPLLAFASGIVLADLYDVHLSLLIFIAAAVTLAAAFFVARSSLFHLSLFLMFLLLGVLSLTKWKPPPDSASYLTHLISQNPVIIEGVIVSRPVLSSAGGNMEVRLEAAGNGTSLLPISGKILLNIAEGEISFLRGDRIRFKSRLYKPHLLGLPGEFDYARYLGFREIHTTARIATEHDALLIRGGAEESLLRRFDIIARYLADYIRTVVPDPAVSSVLTALLLGDQKRIPEELSDAYTRAGVNHILSISGFHVGIIAYIMVAIVLFLLTRSEKLALWFNLRRFSLLLSIPPMFAYLLLTGSSPATARSVIMLSIFVLALYVERESSPVNALLLSALLLVVINPPSVFDVSFQLSFLALWGIVISAPFAEWACRFFSYRWAQTGIQFVVASFAASAATALPVLFYFGRASFNGIISNFLIVPLLGYGAVLTGFFALPFVYLFEPAARLLIWIASTLTAVSNHLVQMFANVPVFSYYQITRFDMLLFMILMGVLTFIRNARIKILVSVVAVTLSVGNHLALSSSAEGRLRITMLSVGQGESLLVNFPDGTNMLVDSGGYPPGSSRNFGQRVLEPALRKLGINRIDRLVLTHGHPDHIGGMTFIARSFTVGEFWEPSAMQPNEEYSKLLSILDLRRIPIRRLSAGNIMNPAPGISIEVFSPGKISPLDDEYDENENSLVFRLYYGSFSMLFMADAGFSAESGMSGKLASTILKVGHHGSRYSTSGNFLDRVKPSIALISAGKDNRFGLPSQETVSLLEKRGILVFRTDKNGSIEVISDGLTWEIRTPFPTD